ncbi:MAG TPA: hypothetical protein VFH78_13305, partial [Candidatus Thermoplasmatota archaeon]|nr:hypothetical protein [Candidatus Thermoplasmatota archaeon]
MLSDLHLPEPGGLFGEARDDAQIEQDPSTSRIVARFTEEAAWLREVEIGEQAPIARVVYV